MTRGRYYENGNCMLTGRECDNMTYEGACGVCSRSAQYESLMRQVSVAIANNKTRDLEGMAHAVAEGIVYDTANS